MNHPRKRQIKDRESFEMKFCYIRCSNIEQREVFSSFIYVYFAQDLHFIYRVINPILKRIREKFIVTLF